MKKPTPIDCPALSATDAEAILCALPLISEIGANNPIQDSLNAQLCASAAKKLISANPIFTSNEMRIISASVTAAVLLLSGSTECGLDKIPSNRKSELSKHFFTLNRLAPILQKAIVPLDM